MLAIFKPVVWLLSLPVRLIGGVLKTVFYVLALPFRIIDFVFAQLPSWFFRWLPSLFRRKLTVPATIVRIWNDPNLGSTGRYWTFVMFDSNGQKIQVRLHPIQMRKFVSTYVEGDVGRATYRGNYLVKWDPATIKKPVRVGAVNRTAFLSYSHEWAAEARFLAKYLGTRGIQIWLDENRLDVGDSLTKNIRKSITQTDYFIPLLSKDYILSRWCVTELELAIEVDCKILPIKVEEGELEMPPHIRMLYKDKLGEPVFADLRKKRPYEQLERLVDQMTA